ncbi:hypothetical protein LMG33818_000049 [Halomonadaceae bacterium LMG 33818]|uniref:DUF3383 domain-containing protein n=1 Tax=Cernens ardua TaxID=3402176 RepID=UPI003EDBD1B3
MAISLGVDATIRPGVLQTAGTALDLNGLILSSATTLPLGAPLYFTNPDDVSSYFGPTADETSMAEIYFQGYDNSTVTPGRLYFSAFNTSDAAAFLRSGSWAGITVADLQKISGSLSITVDNNSVSGNVDLSKVTSIAEAAQEIGTTLGSTVTVSYNTDTSALFITSTSTGATSQISYGSGDAAAALMLTQNTRAQTSQGASSADPATAMNGIQNVNQDWVLFTTAFQATSEQYLAFSKWASGTNDRFGFVGWSNDGSEVQENSTTTLAYQVTQNGYNGTVPVYGDQAHAAGVLAYAASLNFNLNNGRRSLKFRSQQGLIPFVNDNQTHAVLTANGYNFYGSYAENRLSNTYWAQGTITGKWKWLDAFLGQVWFNASLQGDEIELFTSENYLPYNQLGRSAVEAACKATIEQFKDWGGFSAGEEIDPVQAQSIASVTGHDVTAMLYAEGYYFYVGDMTPTMRSSRTTPTCFIWYQDGGVIQQLTINSVEVQ